MTILKFRSNCIPRVVLAFVRLRFSVVRNEFLPCFDQFFCRRSNCFVLTRFSGKVVLDLDKKNRQNLRQTHFLKEILFHEMNGTAKIV